MQRKKILLRASVGMQWIKDDEKKIMQENTHIGIQISGKVRWLLRKSHPSHILLILSKLKPETPEK